MNKYSFFTSQNEQDYHPEVGCGVAALMMLLKASDTTPLPEWRKLCDQLNLTAPPELKGYSNNNPATGLYPEDLFKFVIRAELPFRMHFFDSEWEECLQKAPIMVLMAGHEEEFGEDGHWIVLLKREKNTFTYLDPWYKSNEQYERLISVNDFKRCYTGIAMQILRLPRLKP